MKKRMNKQSLIELINTLDIDKNEFWVLSSGALVIRGIYPDAGDLDIAVTDKGLEWLKGKYNLTPKDNGFYQVNDKIECVCNGNKKDLKYQPEKIDDIYVQNIYEYLIYLEKSTREKDKKRIPLVKNYILKHK
jgi:hypothetical protein